MNTARILGLMKVPPIYRDTFDPARVKLKPETFQHVKDLAKERKWIIICGRETGIGKTRLAVCAMLESYLNDTYKYVKTETRWGLNELGEYGSFVYPTGKATIKHHRENSYQFFSLRRLLKIPDIKDKTELFKGLSTKRCVLLDEMGREPDHWIKNQIDELIFGMEEYGQQVIGTSYLSVKDFRNYYDGSIVRRIEENGEIIELPGVRHTQKEEK